MAPSWFQGRRRPLRRPPQISLRLLLVATAVVALGVAVVATPFHRHREEVWARQQLEQVDGAWYTTSWQGPLKPELVPRRWRPIFERVVAVDLEDAALRPEQLRAVALLRGLRELNLATRPITDADLARWAGMPRLEVLDLSYTRISSAGLAELPRLGRLTWLNLRGTAIDDRAADELVRLSQLKYLDLAGTALSSAAVRRLGTLAELEVLHLERTAVDDRVLVALAEWPRLKYVFCDGTRVTAAGLAQLAAQRPELKASG